jgi:hypothetical protein
LYPIDENFSGTGHGGHHRSFPVLLVSLAVTLLGMIAF